MNSTAKVAKQMAVVVLVAVLAAWVGMQVGARYSQDLQPQFKQGYALRIGDPPTPCPYC